MRKQVTKNLSLVVSGVMAMTMASCTSDIKDVYEGPIVEAEQNPLKGLAPASTFNWTTMEHSSLTIEVDDHFDNQYDYYIHLYAENPMATNKPNALFSGVARGNKPATCSVDLPGATTTIYVEVKDPQGYVMTYGYAAPKAGASVILPCAIGEPAQGNVKEIDDTTVDTRAVRNADFDMPVPAAITSVTWTIPGDAVQLPDADRYQTTANYVVPANTTITLTGDRHYQPQGHAKTRIYVAGTLDIQDFSMGLLNNTELYVLDGGRITGNTVVPQSGAIIAVQEGGEACLQEIYSQGTDVDIYVAGKMYLSDALNLNQADTHVYVAPTGQLIGAEKGSQALEDETYTLKIQSIQGQLYVDGNENNSGQVFCASIDNKNSTAQIVVTEHARMFVAGMVAFQCPIYNAGFFSANVLDGGQVASAVIYNTCTMIVKESITDVQDMYMKHGSLAGGVAVDDQGILTFTPLPLFEYANGWNTNVYLLDGSYMDVQDTNLGKVTFRGSKFSSHEATSLLRVRGHLKTLPLTWGAGAKAYYNLVFEYDKTNIDGGIRYGFGASIADLMTTAIAIENWTGKIPTREEDPNDDIIQTNPFAGNAQADYTVNFEDQWPAIGDYDVNDIVLHMDKIETLQTADKVQEATFTINLKAVGAGYMLGAGIQLDNITNAEIASVEYSLKQQAGMRETDKGAFTFGSNGAEIGNSTDAAVLPICYDAHKAFLNRKTLAANERHPLNAGDSRTAGRALTIKVTFADDATVKPEDLMVSALNFFIYRPEDKEAIGGKRVEVHLKGYVPTPRATDVYNGKGNDNSTGGQYYVSKDGFPWGIIVNDIQSSEGCRPWFWPNESKLIINEYRNFAQWVNSNGKDAQNWMVNE